MVLHLQDTPTDLVFGLFNTSLHVDLGINMKGLRELAVPGTVQKATQNGWIGAILAEMVRHMVVVLLYVSTRDDPHTLYKLLDISFTLFLKCLWQSLVTFPACSEGLSS